MPAEEKVALSEAAGTSAEPTDSSEVGSLLANLETALAASQGEIVQGTVLKVTANEVLVDVGLKSEGAIPRSEFLDGQGNLTVVPGDRVDIWVERFDEKEGTIALSRHKAARLKAWEEVEQAFRERKILSGRVVERVKGGLTVDIGLRAFLPGSQADIRPTRNLDSLVGREITCKVIRIIRKRSNIVVSRKLALEEELNRRKAELRENLRDGAEIVGRVKNITDYGAFLDLGGMDGLLHITDLSWGRVGHPSEILKLGEEVRVKVLKFDPEKERVSLGLKQLTSDPWKSVPATYHPGDRARGRVVSITDYGVFVELAPGVEGLLHISETTWSKRPKHPSKVFKTGEQIEVAVLDINAAQRRISLSVKRTSPDPWSTLGERCKVGSVVEARVRNLTDFGAFVEVEDGVDGLIRLLDLSWARKIKHPSEILKKGQTVKAVVLSFDPQQRRLSLGLKQLQDDPWKNFESRIHVGDLVRGKVVRNTTFGAFVELEGGVEGLCHISEFGEASDSVEKASPEVGSAREFRVIRLDAAAKKIGLSLKKAALPPAPPEGEKATESPSAMAQALTSAGVLPQPTPALPISQLGVSHDES